MEFLLSQLLLSQFFNGYWIDPELSNQSILYYSNLKLYSKQNFQPVSIGYHPILKSIVGSLISNQSSLIDSTSSLLRGFEKF